MSYAPRSLWRLVLLAILLVAFSLRVYRLGEQSLWYDEAVTAQVASQGMAELTRWTADDIQPPLYYYVVAAWTRLAGRGEWALRFPSAFFGTLTVALLWALARRLFGGERAGQTASLVAALLAALSPLYVYYAQEARMYTLLTFLGLLSGYLLVRAASATRASTSNVQRAPLRWWILFVLASTAMLYTHYFAAFLLAAYGVCWFVWWLVKLLRPDPPAVLRHPPTGSQDRFAPRGEGGSGLPSSLGVGGTALPSPRRRGTGGGVRALVYAALSFLGIALLYIPWLPSMLNRYRVDRSYWQGALKLNEALRHVAISFAAGAPETILERDAVRLLPWFGLAMVLAAAALVFHGRRAAGERGSEGAGEQRGRGAGEQGSTGAGERRSVGAGERGSGGVLREEQGSTGALALLLAVLIVPIVAVLLLASRTPKFNPRYLMLASPAYLLILAGGIGALAGSRIRESANPRINESTNRRITHHASRITYHASRITHHASRIMLAVILSGFLIATSLFGLRNWFTDPAFTKAQWRELAATVRASIAPDEAVLLVSGHASPAWDYYAPDIPRARLPDIDVLDVGAVLGFDSGAALAKALAGKAGVWLASWQDDVVDPAGFAPYFLDRTGTEQPLAQKFWHLGLRHWRLLPDATFPVEPEPAHPQEANFDHKLALLGWDDPEDGQLTVYWRTLNTLLKDYKVSLILEDAEGREVGRWDGRPAGYDYPTTRWQPGQALFGRYTLPLPAGAAPGEYTVSLAVYDESDPAGLDIRDVADNPAGKRVRLGPVSVGR